MAVPHHRHKDAKGAWGQYTDQLYDVTQDARISKLEADMIAVKAVLAAAGTGGGGGGTTLPPPPDPNPDPPPGPPAGSYTTISSLSLGVADSGSPGSPNVIDWKEISSGADDGAGVSIQGLSTGSRVHDITLRNFKVTGFHSNFLLRFASRIILEDCWIPDGFYCGFNVFSSDHVEILRPRVDRILHAMPNAQGNNAYGVKIDVLNGGDPVCDNVMVHFGYFKESKLWMNMNAHSGTNIAYEDNEGHLAPRNIFVTSVTGLSIQRNKLYEPATIAGGTTDVTAISYGNCHTGTIKDNLIDSDYPTRVANIDAYTGGASTGIVVGSNPVVAYP